MKAMKSAPASSKGDYTAATSTTTTTKSTTTPFTLAVDENFDDQFESFSTTEGIDVVAAAPAPETFWEWCSLTSGRIVRSRFFRRATLVAILVNAILMGVATVDRVRENHGMADLCDSLIRGFRLLFTIEIVLGMCHYQGAVMQMGWVVFDIVVISLSWFVSLSVLVLRSFRLMRALRKASGVAELNHLVEALIRVTPKMLAVVFLICLVFYIFAVIFTDLYQDLYDTQQVSYNYFGRLDRSAFTLFQVMTLDGWSNIAKEIMDVHPWSAAMFMIFIIITTFFFGSLVVAVMGEAFTSIANQRMMKALEVDDDEVDPATRRQLKQEEDISRLEMRVGELGQMMESLLKTQKDIQASLKRIAEGER